MSKEKMKKKEEKAESVSVSTDIGEEVHHLLPNGVDVYHYTDDVSFRARLMDRKMNKRIRGNWLANITNLLAKSHITYLIIGALSISGLAGFLMGCSSFSIISHCGVSKAYILEEPQLFQSQNKPPLKSEPTSQRRPLLNPTYKAVTTTVVKGSRFNGGAFNGTLLTLAFILAFIRWQVGNNERAMSEVFGRKKEVNKLIMENPFLEILLKGAVEIKDKPGKNDFSKNKHYNADECTGIIDTDFESLHEIAEKIKKLDDFKKKVTGLNSEDDIIFKMKMFVYLELDNLEFAYSKYSANLLSSELMFRSCEIFESRCRDKYFRQMAALQGLSYYTKEFQKVVAACLVFGYHYAGEDAESGN